ncbi:alkaline phosphatase family protein [bacterium]|nr:alkaline phosphatase family protein [bacterium]
MAKKVIVIGWDGATFDVINPLIDKGKLPHLASMIKKGSHGTLASVIPANSAPAWSSFSTGMNPGKHGVYFFTERAPGSYRVRFTHSITRTGKPLWMILSDKGRKAGVINVPGTFPPDMVNGFMISGLDTPSSGCPFTWPEDLAQELKKNVAEYVIESEEARIVGFRNDQERARFVKAVRDVIQTRWMCAKYLFDKLPPDLFILVFTATDRIQHRFWKYMDRNHPHYNPEEAEPFKDAIYDVYMDLDQRLGEILGQMDEDTTLFVMSDHGMGIRSVKTVYLNRWLLAKGYLNLNEDSGMSERIKGILIKGLKRFLDRIKRGMSLNQRRFIRRYLHKAMQQGNLMLDIKNIDWAATQAYSNELMNAVWVNLKGREPLGTVDPGKEYDDLCDEIAQGLKETRDPESGESIVKRVYKRDEIYHGSEIGKAPDLVIEWNNYNPQVSPLFSRKEAGQFLSRLTPEETSRAAMSQNSGDHKPDGILIALGRGIKSGNHVENASIIDMAPTILYAMGEEIPEDMDGRVLKEIFTADFLKANEIRFSSDKQDSYRPREVEVSPGDEEDLKDRLKSLGYI